MKQDKNQNANLKTRNLHWAAWKTTLEEKTDKRCVSGKLQRIMHHLMITFIFIFFKVVQVHSFYKESEFFIRCKDGTNFMKINFLFNNV